MTAGSDEHAWRNERQILNLLHVYAERVDAGDFDGVAELFAHGTYRMADTVLTAGEIADTMRATVRLYDDGTPRTKHLVLNTVLDHQGGAVHARSSFVVLQAADGQGIVPILTGRYLDTFSWAGDHWWFADRRVEIDQVGDLSHHLRAGAAEAVGDAG